MGDGLLCLGEERRGGGGGGGNWNCKNANGFS